MATGSKCREHIWIISTTAKACKCYITGHSVKGATSRSRCPDQQVAAPKGIRLLLTPRAPRSSRRCERWRECPSVEGILSQIDGNKVNQSIHFKLYLDSDFFEGHAFQRLLCTSCKNGPRMSQLGCQWHVRLGFLATTSTSLTRTRYTAYLKT